MVSPPRRPPHCTKCSQPMRGHNRANGVRVCPDPAPMRGTPLVRDDSVSSVSTLPENFLDPDHPGERANKHYRPQYTDLVPTSYYSLARPLILQGSVATTQVNEDDGIPEQEIGGPLGAVAEVDVEGEMAIAPAPSLGQSVIRVLPNALVQILQARSAEKDKIQEYATSHGLHLATARNPNAGASTSASRTPRALQREKTLWAVLGETQEMANLFLATVTGQQHIQTPTPASPLASDSTVVPDSGPSTSISVAMMESKQQTVVKHALTPETWRFLILVMFVNVVLFSGGTALLGSYLSSGFAKVVAAV